MADGARRNGARDDGHVELAEPGLRGDRAGRWPVSAVCCVAVLSVLVLVLLMMNVLGLQLGSDGRYDPDTGGSVAEWFGAIATLVALPAAVLFGVRQLQSTGEAIQLGRRQLEADQAERAERRNLQLAALRRALQVRVEVTNVVDATDLATDAELTAVERWRHEYVQRGWVFDADAATWQHGSVRRSNAEQLTAESSPLVPEPWIVAVTCQNTGSSTLIVEGLTVLVDRVATTIESRAELGPGHSLHRRLGPEVGLSPAYARRSDAEASAARVSVVLDGSDTADRPVRIVHPSPE